MLLGRKVLPAQRTSEWGPREHPGLEPLAVDIPRLMLQPGQLASLEQPGSWRGVGTTAPTQEASDWLTGA